MEDNVNPTESEHTWSDSLVAEIRRLAEIAMTRERPDHTLQPTALVNEAFLRLSNQRNITSADRDTVLAAAATVIRRVLVDHARARNAEKRGGKNRRVPLQVSLADYANDVDVLAIHDALTALAEHSERAARIVELRFFGGMTSEQAARALGVSLRTVNSDWSFAKAWLSRELGRSENTA